MKIGRFEEQGRRGLKKRAPKHDILITPKFDQERTVGSQYVRTPCPTCGKRHHGKCLADTSGCYGCGNNYYKVRVCPTIEARGRETKNSVNECMVTILPNHGHFYALQANKKKIWTKVSITHNILP